MSVLVIVKDALFDFIRYIYSAIATEDENTYKIFSQDIS